MSPEVCVWTCSAVSRDSNLTPGSCASNPLTIGTMTNTKYLVHVSAGLAIDQGRDIPAGHLWDQVTPVCLFL